MRYTPFFSFLILVSNALGAQTAKIAELRRLEAAASGSKEKLAAELRLLDEHESLYKDSLMPLALRSVRLAKSENNKEALGYAHIGLINAFLRQDNARGADSLVSAVSPEYPATDFKLAPVNFLLRQAKVNLLGAKADYESAIKELFSIIRDAEKIGYTPALARSFNELGVIAYNRNELGKALEYYAKVLSYGDQYRDAEAAHAYAYINMAMVHAWQERYDTALYYIHLAKPICERIQNLYYLANAYLTEANIYKWSKRMPEAEAAMLRMVALREQTEGHLSFSNEQLGLANFYVYAKDYAKAISIYNEGLSYEADRRAEGAPPNYELELHYQEGLAKCYNTIGDRDKYEASLVKISATKDSLYEHNSAQAIAEMQTQYEVQKKETTIIAQKLDITRKNVLLYGSLGLLGAVAAISWLVFRNYRRKSEMRLYLLREEEKRRAVEAVRDAEEAERRRIASDLHDNLGSYAASIKSNADELKRNPDQPLPLLELLQSNAQQMVSLLSDTIWAMRKPAMKLSDISDRLKLVLQRLRPSYPHIKMRVSEDLEDDPELAPAHAYHLFMILQEAINNALRHSHGNEVIVHIVGGMAWSVRVSDDGKGISTELRSTDGGNGLLNMRTRAESMNCHIKWARGMQSGTEVVVQTNPF